MCMKSFNQYVSEDYIYERDPSIPKEVYDANDHVVDMISLDIEMRKKASIPGTPLLHDVQTLNVINDVHLGTHHPAKYPQHAKSIAANMKFLSGKVPHLMGHIMPTTPKPWRP